VRWPSSTSANVTGDRQSRPGSGFVRTGRRKPSISASSISPKSGCRPDPEAIAAQVEEEAEKAQRTDVAPSLSPDAKAALLAAYDESRELGASYVGPEHVLLALARDNNSEAGAHLHSLDVDDVRPQAALPVGIGSRRDDP
jgi:ATP-dependent Clp protease ATP-binding subunit ClpA